jgi:hypothetical protein
MHSRLRSVATRLHSKTEIRFAHNRFAFSFFADEKKKQQPHVHHIRKDSPRRDKL